MLEDHFYPLEMLDALAVRSSDILQQIVEACNRRIIWIEGLVKKTTKEECLFPKVQPKSGIMVIFTLIVTHAMILASRLLSASFMER